MSLSKQDRHRARVNAEVQRREYCHCCGRSVRDTDSEFRYISAGGVLEGPFCTETCYWAFVAGDWSQTEPRHRRRQLYYGDNSNE